MARVGIRVYLAVGRGGAPPTNFAITSITARRSAAGWPSIVAHVANTGGRAVDLSGTARLTGGPGNTSAGPFRAQQIITLAPGQSGNLTFGPPKSLPNGPWRASITVLSGLTTSWRDAPPAAAAARQPDARPAAGQRAGARPALTSTDHERTRRKLRLQNVRNSHPLLC